MVGWLIQGQKPGIRGIRMKPKEKVVFVDFRNRRKPSIGSGRAGSKLTIGVFLGFVGIELLAAAICLPSSIGSGFFGPTVIALAVAGTMGVSRLAQRARMARVRRRLASRGDPAEPDPDHAGRTLH